MITRVMLVEDHPEYREIVGLALEKETDLELTSHFGTSERALQSLQDRRKRQTPDLILLDLNLPGMSGLDSIPFFRSAVESAKIIVLTQSDKESDVLNAIRLGASGYLLKSSTSSEIKDGIRTVMKGGASLDANVAAFILKTLKGSLPNAACSSELTLRETEILTLLADGQSKKEIGRDLGISVTTVVTHVGHIYEKLGAKNAPDAIAKGFRRGILRIDDE